MKKFFLSLALFATTLVAGAQTEPTLQAKSIYDVDQDGKVGVQDVPALVKGLLGESEDKTAVDTQSLLEVLKSLRDEIASLKKSQTQMRTSLGLSSDPNLLSGKFTVGSNKQVQFTSGNLYWDGSDYKFEATQTDYPTEWGKDAAAGKHVGHFYWTTTASASYAQAYSVSSASTSDVPFFAESKGGLTVEGTSGLFALSMSEWSYLISSRSNASNLYKYGVKVGDKKNCLIIAPDSFSGTLKSEYTLDEVSSLGLVCLPAAGYRGGSSFNNAESGGYYWSSTPYSSVSGYAYGLFFSSDNVYSNYNYDRNVGRSLRLVRLAQ